MLWRYSPHQVLTRVVAASDRHRRSKDFGSSETWDFCIWGLRRGTEKEKNGTLATLIIIIQWIPVYLLNQYSPVPLIARAQIYAGLGMGISDQAYFKEILQISQLILPSSHLR